MAVRVQITGEGLLDPARLQAWTKETQQQINKAVKRGMFDAKPEVEAKLASHLAAKLQIKRQSFARSMRAYISAGNPDKPPVMVAASKAGWLHAHETGATISGKGKGVLLPINVKGKSGRISYKRFRQMLSDLAAQGNLFFKKTGGKVIAFAEVAAAGEVDSMTGRRRNRLAKVNTKTRAGGKKKEVAIAVLLPRVQLAKRLDLRGLAVSSLAPLVAAKIQQRLDEIGR